MMTLADEEHWLTYQIMLAGFLAALVMTAPYVDWLYTKDWMWAERFPVSWLGIMMTMMTTFFHELGHAVAFWFYGVVAIPSFDVTYGGGMTYAVTPQLWPLNVAVYAGLIYLFRLCKGYRGWQTAWILLGVFHAATAYTDVYKTICTFAGPLAEIAVAGFLLLRAWCDWAPRGLTERFLNAAFGWGMAVHATVQAWALLHDPFVREMFFKCKGDEGMGDFDRIAVDLNINFAATVWFWLGCGLVAVTVPFIIYLWHRNRMERDSL